MIRTLARKQIRGDEYSMKFNHDRSEFTIECNATTALGPFLYDGFTSFVEFVNRGHKHYEDIQEQALGRLMKEHKLDSDNSWRK
jgi:hypothetical protein